MEPVYLDHNATTPLRPEVWERMRPLMLETFGNPSSAHAFGRKARQALEDAREQASALLGAHPDELTFTSGATEANNLAIFGLRPARAVASPIEHPCVVEPLRRLEAGGAAVEWLPADERGVIAWREPAAGADLACVMLVNHETGAVQPVRAIAATLPKGTKLHCDAVQAVGKIGVDFHELGATTLTASAHKFGGPKGVGVLLTKRGTDLKPHTFGGHQQGGRRPGTEPVALAVGMAAALEIATRDLAANRAALAAHRARLWNALRRECAPVVLNGPEIGAADVAPAALNVSFPGCRADLLLMSLDLARVACSTGSACSSGSLLPSPVLRAMGVPDEVLKSALRFSFSPAQTSAEIDEAAARIARCVRMTRNG
ncbi:cysteine desulfurase family protein [Gemmata sp. JC717]|uniref:cysteine desulfurase family protein n=1 Tax=Gemmata algarum TaxID=2975278 RepID=UPI0021BB0133|nr:cysteine desulfurase family protein [Gemmata algarum]MDY3554327.1 cysteine desulfurase family protein [Gemmata algarum]